MFSFDSRDRLNGDRIHDSYIFVITITIFFELLDEKFRNLPCLLYIRLVINIGIESNGLIEIALNIVNTRVVTRLYRHFR